MIEQKDKNNKTQQAKQLVDEYTSKERMEYFPHYENAHAHLLDELRWLNRLLTANMLRLRRVNFYDGLKDFRHFFISDEEIDAMLAAGILENDKGNDDQQITELTVKLLAQAQDMRDVIAQRIRKSEKENIFLPLVHLAKCFQLSPFELQTLVICAAPQIDARYEKLYAYLQNDISKKYPSVDLMLGLFCHTSEQRLQMLAAFHPKAPLQRFSFIESLGNDGAASAAQHFFKVDPNIVYYLLGNNTINTQIVDEAQLLPPIEWSEVAIEEDLQNRLQQLFKMAMDSPINQTPIFYFHGPQGVGRKTIARALCGEREMQLAVFDMRSLIRDQNSFTEKVRLILREGLLQPCAVCFDGFEQLESAADENPTQLKIFIEALQELSWIVFMCSEKPLPAKLLDLDRICPIDIHRPDHETQQRIWGIHCDGALDMDKKLDITQLTSRFDLTGEQIVKALQLAQKNTLAHDPENGEMSIGDLFKASRIQSQPKLSALARKIDSNYQWDDLVLPEDQKSQLRELTNWVRYRHKVMDEWGFADKLSLGRGISALFTGPSGTGKTMAAEVIANDLGLDLYKIDLSAVVSKYIGETEKNLSRIFTEAEHSNAILFFDEADALFGKRSEVKDAHDRYANIEVAYLLQKMEEYEGLVILATNFRKNMDDAFTRRIHFAIDFPFPTEKSRFCIWEKIWPESTPRSTDLDFGLMAQRFEITGGNIRNITLAATFLAANKGEIVNMSHLLLAARREYQKMGKVMMAGEFSINNSDDKTHKR